MTEHFPALPNGAIAVHTKGLENADLDCIIFACTIEEALQPDARFWEEPHMEEVKEGLYKEQTCALEDLLDSNNIRYVFNDGTRVLNLAWETGLPRFITLDEWGATLRDYSNRADCFIAFYTDGFDVNDTDNEDVVKDEA